MTEKELSLRIMMLLSALESWGFGSGTGLPDYLQEEISLLQEKLRDEVLK